MLLHITRPGVGTPCVQLLPAGPPAARVPLRHSTRFGAKCRPYQARLVIPPSPPAVQTHRRRAGAAGPLHAMTALRQSAVCSEPQVTFDGVINGMLTVRGSFDAALDADTVYAILTDYDRCSRIFGNIVRSNTYETDNGKQLQQVCKWQFLAFSGNFDISLAVDEQHADRSLVFTMLSSNFMRDFEGRWHVQPNGSGACRIEHGMAVQPAVPVPPYIAGYLQGIFTGQVAKILEDLQRELQQIQPTA